MARDNDEPTSTIPAGSVPAEGSWRSLVSSWRRKWLRLGLPTKLLLMTTGFVMLAEILIFVPSVSNHRVTWLMDRLVAAELAALAAEAVPGGDVPASLRAELLRTAQVKAVAVKKGGQRRMVLPPEAPMAIDAHFDLRPATSASPLGWIGDRLALIRDALAVFFTGEDRLIRVVGPVSQMPEELIEIVLPEAPLRSVMVAYALNILGLSIIISLITAALVYFALSSLLVQPMMRITRNMLRFSENPEDPDRIIQPSGREDEIGTAERELAQMQRELSQLLLQKNRLAQLGLAVSKVNHDLRNMLANAQLISDRLTDVPDPTVQRFAPKLIASLDRAINFCNDSLKYGRAEEAQPRRDLMRLRPLVEDVGDGLGLPREGQIAWEVEIEDTLRIDADREHLFRIVSNLIRNAIQAIESKADDARGCGTIRVRAWRDGRRVRVEVADDGPGVPDKARANLFRAFQGSRKGGTGLGLAIAAELVAAHGGTLRLLDTRPGATFQFELPDRGTA
ncbi:MAG: HAMP domain-containing sensor histidine kinase [Pseudomonadota bacterium]